MRLISCHIENFGKISEQTFDFSKDCVQICQENGWGKSTLAAFIRVMFYGFAGEGKRNDVENERKRYKPWQGGVYGGMLTFEANNKQYQIFRTFGAKEKDDVFVLRDAKTNLESKDFSKKTGEELFQIDQESFCRTVFISQNDCQTSTNGSINAKLGNLAENTDDINNYEKVDEKLKSLLNGMSPTRKQGSLYKLKDEIAHIEQEVKQGILLDQSIDELNQKMTKLKQEKVTIQSRLEELQEKQKEVSVYQDAKARREQYETACKQLRVRELQLQEQKSYFPGKLPVEWELNEQIAASSELDVIQEAIRSCQLSEKEKNDFKKLERIFADRLPEETEIKEYKEKAKALNTLQLQIAQNRLTPDEEEQLELYERVIGEEIPKDHVIMHYSSQWGTRNQIKAELPLKEKEVQDFKSKIAQSKAEEKKKNPIMMIGICLLLAGICLLFVQTIAGCLSLGMGAVLMFFGIYVQVTKNKTNVQKQKEYQEQLHELEKSIGLSKGKMFSVENNVKCFLQKYQISYEEESVIEQLYDLKNQCKEYSNLKLKKEILSTEDQYQKYKNMKIQVASYLQQFYPVEVVQKNSYMESLFALEKHREYYFSLQVKQGKYQAAQERFQYQLKQLQNYLLDLSFSVPEKIHEQLLEMKEHLQQYKTAFYEYENARKRKEQLEKQLTELYIGEGADIIPNAAEVEETLEQIADSMALCNKRLQEIHETVAQYVRQLNMYQEKRAEIAENEEQLENLKAQYQENFFKYKRIEKTKEFLGIAKESFTAKYMEPILKGFKKYYQILTGKEAMQYQIDANTQLTVKEQGLQRNPLVFSTGYQDLMGICMRMALVDAMYEQEKPFLIFDDPFVNLDEEKTTGGMGFLKEIAKEYQVIYFTCHQSRCVK